MEERRKHEEEISRQVQSAIAPFSTLIAQLRKEIMDLKDDIATIRKENEDFRNLFVGARFMATVGSGLIKIGTIIMMLWGAFLILKK